VFNWTAEQEIWLQKLDHCGITILSVGTIIPDALLLLPFFPYGFPMLVVSGGCCAYACYGIMGGKASLKWQMIVAVWWVFPYMIPNYMLMTSTEFSAMVCTCVFQLIGAIIFAIRRPNPSMHLCGYHEVFHFFVVLAGVSVVVCNYSIVKRYGDMYWLENHTMRD
jgi:hemolysin III